MDKRLRTILGHHKSLILLFSVTILLPAIVLGIFGLRTLGTDAYRLEGNLRREQEAVLGRLRESASDGLNAFGDLLEQVLAQSTWDPANWPELCGSFSAPDGSPKVPGTVFLLTSTGTLLDVKAGYVYSGGVLNPSQDSRLWAAQRLEFTSSNPRQAVRAYRRVAEGAEDELRMLALNGMARTLFRQKQYGQARSAYRTLIEEWPPVLPEESAVFPLMAGLQLGLCAEKLGTSLQDLSLLVGVYERLFHEPRVVDSELVAFYEDAYRKLLDPLCAGQNGEPCRNYDSLRAARPDGLRQVARRQELTRRLHPILRSLAQGGTSTHRRVVRAPEWDGLIVYASRPADSADAGGSRQVLATALSEDDLAALLADSSSAPGADGVHVQVRRPSGALAYATDPGPPLAPSLEAELGEAFPGWGATLFHSSNSPSRTLIDSSRRNSLVLALGLVALLLSGTLLTVRAVVREQEVARLKAGFVSIVSHEFKSPVTSMRTLLEGLRDGLVRDPERQQLYYDVIASELQRLTRLINNLLDFSKIEAGRKAYRPVETDLVELVENLFTAFEPRARRKGFTIERDLPHGLEPIEVDPDALSQVILNLLDNAVKYSPDTRYIRLAVRQSEEAVQIEVEDRGHGIPAEEQTRIFESSFRGADEARSVSGAGIGLAVVKHVIEAHGGSVAVESAVGVGTTFTVRLPRGKSLAGSAGERDALRSLSKETSTALGLE